MLERETIGKHFLSCEVLPCLLVTFTANSYLSTLTIVSTDPHKKALRPTLMLAVKMADHRTICPLTGHSCYCQCVVRGNDEHMGSVFPRPVSCPRALFSACSLCFCLVSHVQGQHLHLHSDFKLNFIKYCQKPLHWSNCNLGISKKKYFFWLLLELFRQLSKVREKVLHA